MALNPPLMPEIDLPMPVHGETFILHRRGVELEAELQTAHGKQKWKESGTLYLSTLRLVFVKKASSSNSWFSGLFGGNTHSYQSELQSYDLPLSHIRGEKFNQPIFGCNHIQADCLPLPGTDGNTHFKLYFTEGVGTLLPLWFEFLNRNRHGRPEAPSGLDQAFQEKVSTGRFMQAAYIDPNDPSQIYISSQPATPQDTSQTREDYFRYGPSAPPPVIPTATAPVIPTATQPVTGVPTTEPSAPPAPSGWDKVQ